MINEQLEQQSASRYPSNEIQSRWGRAFFDATVGAVGAEVSYMIADLVTDDNLPKWISAGAGFAVVAGGMAAWNHIRNK